MLASDLAERRSLIGERLRSPSASDAFGREPSSVSRSSQLVRCRELLMRRLRIDQGLARTTSIGPSSGLTASSGLILLQKRSPSRAVGRVVALRASRARPWAWRIVRPERWASRDDCFRNTSPGHTRSCPRRCAAAAASTVPAGLPAFAFAAATGR